MDRPSDAYYFMFEIGWFLDLLIPTLVRVKDGSIYLVGSKPCNIKDLKPCCIPCGGSEECKKYSFDNPSIKAFKCLESLTAIQNPDNLEDELQKNLANSELRDRYFNTKGKAQKEATAERVMNDYRVLSIL